MSCSYCRRNIGHEFGCPFYESKKTGYYCSICKEEIYVGDRYVENNNGEYAHWDCVDYNSRDLLDFLGYKIKYD